MKKLLMTIILSGISWVTLAGVDIIVHPSNESVLDDATIARIFLGKTKSFPDGSLVIPIGQIEESAVVAKFNNLVLNKSASQIKAYWSKLVFTGKGSPPRMVDNDLEIIELVKANPNLIGFVNSGTAAGADVRIAVSFKD